MARVENCATKDLIHWFCYQNVIKKSDFPQ